MVVHFLDKDSAKRNDSFRNSEWGPEAAEALAREVRVFKVPGGQGWQITYSGRLPRQNAQSLDIEGDA